MIPRYSTEGLYDVGEVCLASDVAALEKENSDLKARCESTYCAFCGEFFSMDRPDKTDAVTEHIRSCEKHPMREVEQENAALRAQLAALREAAEPFMVGQPWLDYRRHWTDETMHRDVTMAEHRALARAMEASIQEGTA